MLINTFWKIILKGIGLSLLIYLIDILATSIALYSSVLGYASEADGMFLMMVLNVMLLAAYISVLRLFLFKTDWLLKVLKLEKSFKEESINIKVPPQSILKIIVIVLAGLIFVEAVPGLIQQLLQFWQMPQLIKENDRIPVIAYHLIRAIVAFLAMTNSDTIVKWITKDAN